MSLAWSMDKIGPITRSVEDCAVVLAAIHGRDGLDPTVRDRPFHWPAQRDLKSLTVGYFAEAQQEDDRQELRVLRELGVRLVPIELPKKYPVWPLTLILNTEAAAVFDDLTRQDNTQGIERWATVFRQAEFVPAVEYLRANRVRSLLMQEMEKLMRQVDCYVGGDDLGITNLTGHPTVVLPNGHRELQDGGVEPASLTFTGQLFGESDLLSLAHAYQQATGHHLRRPEMQRLEPVKEPDEPK